VREKMRKIIIQLLIVAFKIDTMRLTSRWRYDNLSKERLRDIATTTMSTSINSISQGKIVLTYDDYRDLPNDRNRYEILDGELSVTPAPSTKHQRISGRLYLILAQHVFAKQLGEVYAAPTDLILAPAPWSNPILFSLATIAAVS